ncbi:unnamed protein product [Spirodela intermedia]|uniref:cellulase n=1 Tax=Spirodela intermedia TaxID=51605 RepID=A0A7I8JRY9_SPIIN|nr:unnamed protein product [Spirodela intermedia]CAA6672899.1 unnamed protein product [Spirodela intermedia]
MSAAVVMMCLTVWTSVAASGAQEVAEGFSPLQATGYADAIGKAILFFEGQRSGKLPSGQRVTWRGDSALSDGRLENVNLVGGYYDAGDNVKFVWPMSFSVTLLSMALVEYGSQVAAASQLGNLRTAIRWGRTSFYAPTHLRQHSTLRSTTLSPSLSLSRSRYGNSDHQCWERPEDMDTPRTLSKITPSSPGTEAAADAAAALASAYIVFRGVDANYSANLLAKSRTLFDFADKYRGSYQKSCPFYCSYSGFQDELLWAAAWLYKATKESRFLRFLTDNQGWSTRMNEFSWDNKYAGAQVLLAKVLSLLRRRATGLARYKSDADSFVCSLMPRSSSRQIRTTPGGLLFTRDNSNIQYVASATFLLSLHARTTSSAGGVRCGSTAITASEISAFAKSQVDYILGKNPLGISYMAGYGQRYPTQVHHRGASIPSIKVLPGKVSCGGGFSTWFNAPRPNPNVHVGAIDIRSDYSHLEPTTYINAAFVGAVAPFVGSSTILQHGYPGVLSTTSEFQDTCSA